MHDVAHVRPILLGRCVGVPPEIEAVHVAEVEPVADVVRVIVTLTRTRVEREAARHGCARRGENRKENGFVQRRGIDVRGEGLAANQHVYSPLCVVPDDLDGL